MLSIGSKLKELSEHTLIYGIGSAMQSLLTFLLIPIYTYYFSVEEYGSISLIILIGSVLGTIFYFGISGSLSRSYYDYEDEGNRKKVVTTSLILTILGASIQVIIGLLFSEKFSIIFFENDQYTQHIFLVICVSSLTFLNNIFFLILRFKRKSLTVILLNIMTILVGIGSILFFINVLKLGTLSVFTGQLLTQFILIIILILNTFREFGFKIKKEEIYIQLKFGIPTLLTAFFYLLITSSDRFLQNHFLTLEDVGIYSLGFLIGTGINIVFVQPFSLIWSPVRMEYRNDSNAREFLSLLPTYYFLVGLSINLILTLFSMELIILFTSNADYYIAYQIVPIISLAFLIFGSMNLFDHGIFFQRKVYIHSIIFALCFIINFLLNYFLLPIFGYKISGINLIITFIIGLLLIIFISNKIEKYSYKTERLFRLILLFFSVIFCAYIFSKYVGFFGLIAIKSMLLILYGYIIFNKILEDSEKKYLNNFFINKI